MKDKFHLLYFLNTQKDNLGFVDELDFIDKIRNSFDFRFKVQKYVFISKYFGWNHHYNYNLYINGPYSTALANDYYAHDIFKNDPLKITAFDLNSFNEFIFEKNNFYLEATSTILFEELSSLDEAVDRLNELKPYITKDIVKKSFEDIAKNNLTQDNYIIEPISESINETKDQLKNKIKSHIEYFRDFGRCNNSIIVAGCLDYLRIVLIEENLNMGLKDDLLHVLNQFISEVDKIYDFCEGDGEKFADMDLSELEELFNNIQDYVSQDLKVLPRIDDESFEKYFNY